MAGLELALMIEEGGGIRQKRRILLLHGLAPAAGTTDLARGGKAG